MRTELKNITTADDLESVDFFIGTRNNGDGTYTDYKFTYAQVAALAGSSAKKRIVVGSTGATLADVFFATHDITEIVTKGQAYIIDVNFSQIGDTITNINMGNFKAGQILIAKE